MSQEDPGWRPILKPVLLIPALGPLYLRRRGSPRYGLLEFRLIYVGLAVSVWLFAFVLLFVIPPSRYWSTNRRTWFVFVVLVVGILSHWRLRVLRNKPLDASSPEKLAASYRGNAFIGIGHAESTALVAFVGTFVMDALWIYLVGLAFSTLGLLLIGPTKRELQHRQEQIHAQGSSLSLVAALLESPPPGRHRP